MAENEHYEVINDGDFRHAVGVDLRLTVKDGKIFHRNGIEKNLRTGITTHKRWLVGEVNGVRLYINGNNLIMTTQDLNP